MATWFLLYSICTSKFTVQLDHAQCWKHHYFTTDRFATHFPTSATERAKPAILQHAYLSAFKLPVPYSLSRM